jgi:hypothetical protein
MSEQSFPRRWIVLGAIGLATSVLLTVGIALLGMRGVASANGMPATPTPGRAAAPMLIREIGGPARTPTPGPGGAVAPTLPFDNEPARAMLRPADPGTAPAPAAAAATSLPTTGSLDVPPPTVPPFADRLLPPPALPPAPVLAAGGEGGQPPAVVTATATALPPPTYPPFFRPPAAAVTATAVPAVMPTLTTDTDDLPTVSLVVSDHAIDIGDSVMITVMGSDDRGLSYISWEGIDVTDPAFDKETRNNCGSQRQCARSWSVTATRGGTQTLQARARDSSGQLSRPVSVDIKVRGLQPTSTPTDAPTARPTATAVPPTATPVPPTATPRPASQSTTPRASATPGA